MSDEVTALPSEEVQRAELGSGLRIVTERVPGARSVTVGFYATLGSRDEPSELAGASHFLEHLLFKGTADRSARDIAMAIDAVGGEMNAFTGREATAYYARLPAAQLDLGLDLLGDVVSAPAFRPAEVDAEREVIVEELLMSEDDPDDVVHKALQEAAFPDHPLGRETLGTLDTIEALTRDAIASFHAENYRPSSLIVAVAGDLEHDHVVDRIGGLLDGSPTAPPLARTAPSDDAEALIVVERETEQVHLELGWRSLDVHDPQRYALLVGNHVLGGGMASRLFQEVREERGLAYTVHSSPSMYVDGGLLSVVASTGRSRLSELLGVIDDVVERLLTDGITEEEHRVALGYLEGATLLSLEDTGSRMARLAGNEMVEGRVVTVEESLSRLAAVTREEVGAALRRVLDAPRSVAAVGAGVEGDRVLERAASWHR